MQGSWNFMLMQLDFFFNTKEVFKLGNLNELASSVPLPCIIASNAFLNILEGHSQVLT